MLSSIPIRQIWLQWQQKWGDGRGFALPAAAQDDTTRADVSPPPDSATTDKSTYTLFDPTPDSALRSFNTDRPTKSNSPITVDAGHFQYESDLVNYTHSSTGGVSTRLYTAFDPVVSHPVGPSLTVYGEFYAANGTDARLPPVYTFDTAVAWAVTDTLQLDAGINIGLNRNAPNLQAYTGIAQRF